MSRARNRQRISALGAPVAPAVGAVPQGGAAPQAGAALQVGAVPVPPQAAAAVPLHVAAVPQAAAAIPQAAPAAGAPPGGVAGNQAPAQGANDQEAQRQAMEAQLRMQLQNLLRAPIDPVELDKRLVIDGMRRVKDLREGEYEDWILKVSDALLQAGMHAMYNITGVQRDELADEADVRACSLYPVWALNTAWSAIRSSLPAHGPAQAKTLSIRPGDVKTLLRTIRNFYESSTINEQHSILPSCRTRTWQTFPTSEATWPP